MSDQKEIDVVWFKRDLLLHDHLPLKQGHDHDPKDAFIRQWIPELGDVPTKLIHEPWRMSRMEQKMYDCELGREYPKRLLDHRKAYKKASNRLLEKKTEEEVKHENDRKLKNM